MSKFVRHIMAAALLAAAAGSPAMAQGWPNKPITLIIPFAAGGPSDTLGRLMAEHMGRTLGQQIIVENVAGAGGNTGAERAAKAAPDGYTLFSHHSGLTAAPALYSNLRYDPRTAFEPMGLINNGPMVLTSRKTLEANNAKELFDWLKKQGDKATVAHAGVGSNSFMCGMLLSRFLGTKPSTPAYRGTGPAMNDLVGGQIDVLCDQATTAVPQIKAGTIKAYLVTQNDRLASLNEVPSAREAGAPGMVMTIWNGIYAPKGTPKDVVQKVNAAVGKFLDDPAIVQRFADTGTVPFPKDMRSPEAHAKWLTEQFAEFEKLFADTGYKKQEAN